MRRALLCLLVAAPLVAFAAPAQAKRFSTYITCGHPRHHDEVYVVSWKIRGDVIDSDRYRLVSEGV